jgi:hypothetical protein
MRLSFRWLSRMVYYVTAASVGTVDDILVLPTSAMPDGDTVERAAYVWARREGGIPAGGLYLPAEPV